MQLTFNVLRNVTVWHPVNQCSSTRLITLYCYTNWPITIQLSYGLFYAVTASVQSLCGCLMDCSMPLQGQQPFKFQVYDEEPGYYFALDYLAVVFNSTAPLPISQTLSYTGARQNYTT